MSILFNHATNLETVKYPWISNFFKLPLTQKKLFKLIRIIAYFTYELVLVAIWICKYILLWIFIVILWGSQSVNVNNLFGRISLFLLFVRGLMSSPSSLYLDYMTFIIVVYSFLNLLLFRFWSWKTENIQIFLSRFFLFDLRDWLLIFSILKVSRLYSLYFWRGISSTVGWLSFIWFWRRLWNGSFCFIFHFDEVVKF